jgi:hypothetical protein
LLILERISKVLRVALTEDRLIHVERVLGDRTTGIVILIGEVVAGEVPREYLTVAIRLTGVGGVNYGIFLFDLW